MLTNAVKERLAEDVQRWQADGLVSEDTAAVLRERYETSEFSATIIIKYLGITGGLFSLFGVMGGITFLASSALFAALEVAGVALGFFWVGLRLSADPRNRYATSSRSILAIGAIALASAIGLVAHAAGMGEGGILLLTGVIWLPVMFVLSYRFNNSFLLIVTLLGLFHWVGTWNEMMGHSSYAFSVQDPVVMSCASLVVIAIGIWHERRLQRQTLRFYRVYEALGLLYLNLSLLILSIWHDHPLSWVLVLTAAAIAQIVLASYLKNGLMLGFGMTFAAIDLYTRYFETFWEKLDAGLFFLAGGAVLLGFGIAFERVARDRRRALA